jgi:hypothetical protein
LASVQAFSPSQASTGGGQFGQLVSTGGGQFGQSGQALPNGAGVGDFQSDPVQFQSFQPLLVQQPLPIQEPLPVQPFIEPLPEVLPRYPLPGCYNGEFVLLIFVGDFETIDFFVSCSPIC